MIIKSINFSREALVLSVLLKNLFSHFFELLLFGVALLFFKVSLIGILYYFILLIFFCFFIFGFSAILVALTVYFVDLENIFNFGTRILWLATPIFYSIGGQTRLFYLNLLNPIYFFITAAREMIIYNSFPEMWIVAGITGYSLIFFVTGLVIFEKLKAKFTELI
jgi:ABC-type polysaccharide/polyol phosphate export permease